MSMKFLGGVTKMFRDPITVMMHDSENTLHSSELYTLEGLKVCIIS